MVDPTRRLPVVPKTTAAARRETGRRIYGAVYCCQTAVDPDKYVGQAGPRTGRNGQRVQAAPGRRVDEHRARKDWGAEILPGRDGYRVLEWVHESGHGPEYDAANLTYREYWWIQHVNPTENDRRPVPVPPDIALARRVERGITRQRITVRRRPFAWFRTVSFLFWWLLYGTILAGGLSTAEAWWVPWLFAPLGALPPAWMSLWAVRRSWDRLTRPRARPPARRRRRRGRRR